MYQKLVVFLSKLTKMTSAFIVDENANFCKSLTLYFEDDEDLTITNAFQDLESAFQTLQTNQPNLLLIDAKLLDNEGQKIIKKIKTQYPIIKCILLTSFLDNDNHTKALQLGISGYLIKGNDPEALRSEILKVD
jgi:DNA-binding NarL/FixJ family response regulator